MAKLTLFLQFSATKIATIFLFSFVTIGTVLAKNNTPAQPATNWSSCSDEMISDFLTRLSIVPKVKTEEDSDAISDARIARLNQLCTTCAMVSPYDTVIRRVLLQFLKTEPYPLVRAEAANCFSLLKIKKNDVDCRDIEIVDALTGAMRHDPCTAVRLVAAHSLISYCHQDTSEVLDTLIRIAMGAPNPPYSKNQKPCLRCLAYDSKLRRRAVKSLADKAFYGNERILKTLDALSFDSDNAVSEMAKIELNTILKRLSGGEQ